MKIDKDVLRVSANQAFRTVFKTTLFIVGVAISVVGLLLWAGSLMMNPLPTIIATPFIAGAIYTVDLYRKNLKHKRKYGR